MQRANREAQRFDHEFISTEHILLGLVNERIGLAVTVLKDLNIDLRKLRLEVESNVKSGPCGAGLLRGGNPQTARAKKVIEYAVEEARVLGHDYVGTEHLLLGLLREPEGLAAEILINTGVKLEDVREQIRKLL
jgi:ATP-dependent Clp protease ATP-binding subunit ClpC